MPIKIRALVDLALRGQLRTCSMPCALLRSAYGSALALGAQPAAVSPTTLSSLPVFKRLQTQQHARV